MGIKIKQCDVISVSFCASLLEQSCLVAVMVKNVLVILIILRYNDI